MTFYGVLADIVVAFHLAYMGYVLFGQLAIMIGWPLGWRWIRNPWFRGTHLAMILVVAFEGLIQFECPLTTLEHQLRHLGGQTVTPGETEVEGISFTGQMLRNLQFAGNNWDEYVNTSFYIAAGVIVATLFLVPPRFRREPAPTPTSTGDSAVTPGPMSTAIASGQPPDPPRRDSR